MIPVSQSEADLLRSHQTTFLDRKKAIEGQQGQLHTKSGILQSLQSSSQDQETTRNTTSSKEVRN